MIHYSRDRRAAEAVVARPLYCIYCVNVRAEDICLDTGCCEFWRVR